MWNAVYVASVVLGLSTILYVARFKGKNKMAGRTEVFELAIGNGYFVRFKGPAGFEPSREVTNFLLDHGKRLNPGQMVHAYTFIGIFNKPLGFNEASASEVIDTQCC